MNKSTISAVRREVASRGVFETLDDSLPAAVRRIDGHGDILILTVLPEPL